MFDDRYNELKRLKNKHIMGILIILIYAAIIFLIPLLLVFEPNLIRINISNPTVYTMIFVIISVVLFILLYSKLCAPYNKYLNELNKEIKSYYLNKELTDAFNDTYNAKEETDFYNVLSKLEMGSGKSKEISDYFSAEYNNVSFDYIDLEIYSKDSEGNRSEYFDGHVYIFDLKNQMEGNLYIGTKEKVLLGYMSDLELLLKSKNYQEIKPINNTLKDNILLKSNTNLNIIENSSFQEAINTLIDSENIYEDKNILIYDNNKLYFLLYNHKNSFNVYIKNKEDEVKLQERIKEDINEIKTELDNILRFKEVLNIKDNNWE